MVQFHNIFLLFSGNSILMISSILGLMKSLSVVQLFIESESQDDDSISPRHS